uniref:Polyamine transporter 1 n=1 Tax=Mycena chlorophos TaxID=658473 RepID=A0ABQ0KYT6_MYCCL|nr:polyamine transporter 1 [Mycena chlorophos]
MADPERSVSSQSSTIREEEVMAADYLDEPPVNEKDPFLVDSFDEGDPTNPMNWSRLRRWYLTALAGVLVLNATFASAARKLFPKLHPSEFTVIVSLRHRSAAHRTLSYVRRGRDARHITICGGLCRRPITMGSAFGKLWTTAYFHLAILGLYCATRGALAIAFSNTLQLFQVGAALSKNKASLLVFRFLGGIFAAAPLTNSGAILADIWDAGTRGKALAIFTLMPFAGPTLGPTVAGFIAVSGTDFRWVFWAGVCCIATIFTLPETYRPVLLARVAKKKREETGDTRYYAPIDRIHLTFLERAENVLGRPFKMLALEPMLLIITIYMSFVYGNLYLLFEAYPIVFTEGHGLNAGLSGLTFLPILVGGAAGVTVSVIYFNPRYERKAVELAPHSVPPEFRLEMALFAAPLYTVAFFWFGWTSYPSVSLWAPLMAGFPMGFAINWIFLSLFNYLIDTYLFMAASALAASTVVRSVFGAAFPLFATQMYKALNPRWASSLLGSSKSRANSVVTSDHHLDAFKMPPLALRGVVTKVGLMQKTATVLVSRWAVHPLTGKRMERSKKYLTHDPENKLRKEDIVVIRNCPPVSKLKRFKLETVLQSPEAEREALRAKMQQQQ